MINCCTVKSLLLGMLMLNGCLTAANEKASQPMCSVTELTTLAIATKTPEAKARVLAMVPTYVADARTYLQQVKKVTDADATCLAAADASLAELQHFVEHNAAALQKYYLGYQGGAPKSERGEICSMDKQMRECEDHHFFPAHAACLGESTTTTSDVRMAVKSVENAFCGYVAAAMQGKEPSTLITPSKETIPPQPSAAGDSSAQKPTSVVSQEGTQKQPNTLPSTFPILRSNHLGLLIAAPLAAVLVGVGAAVVLIKKKILGNENDKIVKWVNRLLPTAGVVQ